MNITYNELYNYYSLHTYVRSCMHGHICTSISFTSVSLLGQPMNQITNFQIHCRVCHSDLYYWYICLRILNVHEWHGRAIVLSKLNVDDTFLYISYNSEFSLTHTWTHIYWKLLSCRKHYILEHLRLGDCIHALFHPFI